MLVLFDIDGTLLTSNGAGAAAMESAGRSLYGSSFTSEGVAFSGRLDPLILRDLAAANGVEFDIAAMIDFRRVYAEMLTEMLESEPAVALEGAAALVEAVASSGGATTGLLTGNFPETGTAKLRSAGLDVGAFEVCVWGDDSPHEEPHRDHLPAVARKRHLEQSGADVEGELVVIVGDTPHDVGCARAHGHRSLAVATGRFGERELGAAGACRVAADLRETDELASWVLGDVWTGGARAAPGPCGNGVER